MNNKKIKLYVDGPTLDQINENLGITIDGYTFNPSLFKKNGAKDYLDYSKEILQVCKNKPVSLEVFADDEENMIRQGRLLKDLGNNVYVKIPIVYTNGKSTINVIRKLAEEDTKLNITAIFLIDQIKERDERDKTRSSSPLIAASDAKVFDTSNLSIKEAIDHVLYYIQTKI